jgi:hypothetical protein
MFLEIDPKLMKTHEGSQKKRWFRDSEDGCDLFVWEDDQGEIKCFQFWYQDALVEWDRESGIKTGSIDNKSGAFVNLQSDIYQIDEDINLEILDAVKDILNKKSEDNNILVSIKETLYKISENK